MVTSAMATYEVHSQSDSSKYVRENTDQFVCVIALVGASQEQ